MHERIAERRLAVERARRAHILNQLEQMLDDLEATARALGESGALNLERHRRQLATLRGHDGVPPVLLEAAISGLAGWRRALAALHPMPQREQNGRISS